MTDEEIIAEILAAYQTTGYTAKPEVTLNRDERCGCPVGVWASVLDPDAASADPLTAERVVAARHGLSMHTLDGIMWGFDRTPVFPGDPPDCHRGHKIGKEIRRLLVGVNNVA